QKRNVARVDATFHGLQVIAFLPALAGVAMRCWQSRPFKGRKWWLILWWPHVGPQYSAAFYERIGFELDLPAEAGLLWFRGNVDALPRVVVLPTVIGAAQPVSLIATEPQGHAAMGAELIDQSKPAPSIAEPDQSLRKKLDADRRTFGLGELFGQQCRNPIPTE